MSGEVRRHIDRCPTFGGLDERHRELLAEASSLHRVGAGTMLFRQGDPCPGIVVIAEGAARVFKLAASGKEHVLRLVEPPQSFLEVAVIGGFDCPACAETAEPTTYVVVPNDVFRGMLERDHDFCLQLLGGLAFRVRSLIGLLEDIVLRDATARIASHLLANSDRRSGAVTLHGSHKDLASHLNLTPETFSRALRRLSQAGVIAQERGALTILDRGGLENAAEGAFPRL